MSNDSAQGSRIAQRVANVNGGVQFITNDTYPQAPWDGMLVYNTTVSQFQIYDLSQDGWLDPFLGASGLQTYVGDNPPVADAIGDLWIHTPSNILERWDGVAWTPFSDPRILEKNQTFTQISTDVPEATAVGDMWYVSDMGNLTRRWNGTAWVDIPTGDAALDSALKAYIDQVTADRLKSGAVVANVQWVGGSLTNGDTTASHVSMDPSQGFVLYGPDGTTSIAEMRTDGQPSLFRGQVLADQISVMNGLVVQGNTSQVVAGATMQLSDSVNSPIGAPSITQGYGSFDLSAVSRQRGFWQSPYGPLGPSANVTFGNVHWDQANGYYYQLGVVDFEQCFRPLFPNLSSPGGWVKLPYVPGYPWRQISSMVRVGTKVFIATGIYNDPTNTGTGIYEFSFDGATCTYVGRVQAATYKNGGSVANFDGVVGPDQPTLLAADAAGNVYVFYIQTYRYSIFTAATGVITQALTAYAWDPGSGRMNRAPDSASFGSIDGGPERLVLSRVSFVLPSQQSGAQISVLDPAHMTSAPVDNIITGPETFYWHSAIKDGHLQAFDQTLYGPGIIFSSFNEPTNSRLWFGYTEAKDDVPSGLIETKLSPKQSIVLTPRMFVNVSAPGRHAAADYTVFYLKKTTPVTAEPADSAMERIPGWSDSTTLLLSNAPTTAGAPPVDNEWTTGGTAETSEFSSQSGDFVIRGDGTGSWPLLDELRDSGWVALTPGSSEITLLDSAAIRMIGTHVYMRGSFKSSDYEQGLGSTTQLIAVVPDGYRPAVRKTFNVVGTSLSWQWSKAQIETNGNINFWSSASNSNANTEYPLDTDWFID